MWGAGRARCGGVGSHNRSGKTGMADINKLAEEIVGLTLLEAQELKTVLRDKYGIEPAAGGAVMVAGPAAGGETAQEAEEKTDRKSVV